MYFQQNTHKSLHFPSKTEVYSTETRKPYIFHIYFFYFLFLPRESTNKLALLYSRTPLELTDSYRTDEEKSKAYIVRLYETLK